MNDFFNDLGELALGSRLKRLSDRLNSDALSVYKHFNLPIQPKWFTLLALLDRHNTVSVVEAADRLKLSQPALSQFCKQLVHEGLVEILFDENDSRKRVMTLTSKGLVTVSNMKVIWTGVEQAAKSLCINNKDNFYSSLLAFEQAIDSESLLERTKSNLAHLTVSEEFEFLPFSDELAPFFEVINTEWIESMFSMEEIDRQVLRNPKQNIIDNGGHIWFAKHPLYGIVGTCALLKSGEGEYELTKMGVLKSARGLKVGERLLKFVITQSKLLKSDSVYLLTNKRCEAAIHLYEKLGFEHSSKIMEKFGCHYERCDVAMLLAQ